MKPKRIILVRHGQSEGNVDKTVYTKKPDYALRLTAKGRVEASNKGVDLKRLMGSERAFFYVSPFHRTRETFQEIVKAFDPTQYQYREDPRIREQEWAGKFQLEGYDETQERERMKYGSFYYRFQGGESCADVYERVSGFLDSLFRDFEKPEFPENCVIVSHGMAMRVFVMRWFHMTVEDFEVLRNPANCKSFTLLKQANDKYKLSQPLEQYDAPDHPYQMPIVLN